ncbi:MAG: EAL domain-containing protein [Cyanobacteria bacterium P01_F01_bin.150]
MASGITAIAIVSGILNPLERLAHIALFQIRGSVPWHQDIVVVEVDEPSLNALDHFPLSRRHYATLLEKITPANPTVVVFDILFIEPSDDDDILARTMIHQGNVILAEAWDIDMNRLRPTSTLNDAAIMTGHILRDDDSDGINRKVRTVAGARPSLGLASFNVHQWAQGTLRQSAHPPVSLWINWPGPVQEAPHYSFTEVIQGKIPTDAFQNKIVLVGVTAIGQDPLKTPYDWKPPTAGVYFHAAVLNTLLQDNGLQLIGHSRWFIAAFLFVGGPSLSWLLVGWGRGQQFLASLGLAVAWCLLSIGLFHGHYWISTVTPMVLCGLTGGFVTASEQWRTYLKLRDSEERYDLAVTGTNEGIWDWHVKNNTLYVSPRWKSMVGSGAQLSLPTSIPTNQPPQRLSSTEQYQSMNDWLNHVHPDDLEMFQLALTRHLNGKTPFLEQEYRLIHHDGSIRWMLIRGILARDRHGAPLRMAGSQTDITRRKVAEAQLVQQAFYDPLTNLPNRTLFLKRLEDVIADRQSSNNQPSNKWISVFLIDIDRFQLINNSLGNQWGDRLLIALANRFQDYLEEGDLIARLGGDEYAILSIRFNQQSAQAFAQDLQDSLSAPFLINHRDVFVSMSIGIVVNSRHYNQPEHWLRDADTALSNAKALGKSCCKVFQNKMRTVLLKRLDLENDLRRVLLQPECPGLLLNYQPIVYLKTREIRSFEALVRWQHADHGLIPPGQFIPMAEETGLIVPLGEWVLRTSCAQMKQWTTKFFQKSFFTMSVNLASKQCALPDFPELVQEILDTTQLAASYLKLELTESAIMDNAASLIDMLHRLRSMGVQLAIDDFGTGYSSLSYLRRFPVHNLKIDQSFVSNMENEADSVKIIQTIVDLAHSLGLDVTAEGLETLEHSSQLKSLQCEYGQGYFFSKPVDAATATQLLEAEACRVA